MWRVGETAPRSLPEIRRRHAEVRRGWDRRRPGRARLWRRSVCRLRPEDGGHHQRAPGHHHHCHRDGVTFACGSLKPRLTAGGCVPGCRFAAPFRCALPTADGQPYVYQDYKSGMIRAVNVANGTSGAVTPGGGMQLIGVIDSGVYAASAPNSAGAYFVPFGGQPQQLVDHGTWDRYDRGALWGRDASNKLV